MCLLFTREPKSSKRRRSKAADWLRTCEPCVLPPIPDLCCEENPLPDEIFADVAVTGCTTVTGVPLDFVGGTSSTGIWRGTADIGACTSATIEAHGAGDIEGGCSWQVIIKNSSGDVCFDSGVVIAANPCLVIPVNRSGTWSNPPCACCTNGGSVSVDLYR